MLLRTECLSVEKCLKKRILFCIIRNFTVEVER